MNPFVANKLLRFPGKLAEWMKQGTTDGPIGVDLDLTNRCPHDCPLCPGEWKQSPGAQLTADEALDYLRQFRELGTRGVNFAGGGEPLAHPQAEQIICAAADMGFSVGVMTNGSCLTNHKMLAQKCAWIRVSLDAATPERHSVVHGVPKSEFGKVSDNVRRLAATEHRAVIGVSMLTEATNRHEIHNMAAYAKSLGVDYVQFRPFNHDQTDVSEDLKQAVIEYNDDAFKVYWAAMKYELMGKGYTKLYDKCHAHHFWSVVNADAHLQLCCDCREPEFRLGNLREQTLREIWYSKRRREVYESVDVHRCVPLCRFNQHNLVLDKLSEPILHEAHL